jgi:hypothetical protein
VCPERVVLSSTGRRGNRPRVGGVLRFARPTPETRVEYSNTRAQLAPHRRGHGPRPGRCPGRRDPGVRLHLSVLRPRGDVRSPGVVAWATLLLGARPAADRLSRERRVERTPPIDVRRNANSGASVTSKRANAPAPGGPTAQGVRASDANGPGVVPSPCRPAGVTSMPLAKRSSRLRRLSTSSVGQRARSEGRSGCGLERREASDRRDEKPAVHTGYMRGR